MSVSESSTRAVLSEVEQCQTIIAQIQQSLAGRQSILRRRGIRLPAEFVQLLQTVKTDMHRLEKRLLETETELNQLRALADVSTQITTSLDIDLLLEQAMDIVISLTHAERGYMIFVNESTGELEYRITRHHQNQRDTQEVSTTIIRQVLDTGQSVLSDNAHMDKRFGMNVSVARLNLRSVLCVPLTYKNQTNGVVYVDNRLHVGIFTEREKNLLVGFANTASVAISNAQYYTRIQHTLREIIRVKELMDNVFASIDSGVIATDERHRVTTFNRAAEEILHCDVDMAIGYPLEQVMSPVQTNIDTHLADVENQDTTYVIEANMQRETGEMVAVNMKLNPLKDTADTVQGVTVVIDDVTEQKQRDQELQLMKYYLPPQMVDQIHEISNLALGGERREVTCMFVSVMPFPSMTRNLRPKETLDSLNNYLSIVTHYIHQCGGIVDKYIGNEIMALFNTSLNPDTAHSCSAIEAGLLIREQFYQIGESRILRIGIHTGVATLGNVGNLNRREFTAIGDNINLSKRLQENAHLDQILVSETSCSFAEKSQPNRFQFQPLATLNVKGRQGHTQTYEVFRTHEKHG